MGIALKKLFSWLAALSGVAALVFFGLLPPLVERSMNRVTGPQPPQVSARAAALHKTLQIADMHADTLMWKRDPLARGDRGQVDLPRLADGNVALQILSSVSKTPKGQNYDANGADTDNITLLAIAQGQPVRTWHSLVERSLWHATKLQRAEAASRGELRIVRTKSDLATLLAVRNDQTKWPLDHSAYTARRGYPPVGALLSIEGLQDIEGKRANLDRLDDAGFRMAGLAHFFDNEVAGSMHGLKKGGLTPFGIEIVRAMEAKGMVVDIAHCSHQCVAEVLKMAKHPVVSSHGGVQATCKVNRNLTDVEIKGVAATGGVVGIGYWDAAVCDTSPAGIARAIAHVRDLVGIDHVGLGSDYDGAISARFDTSRLDAITQALIDAGFSDADIAKVMGGNVLRVLGQVLPN
jgi:microsomal dipeptidase-like Zn-dependent dipeptidase